MPKASKRLYKYYALKEMKMRRESILLCNIGVSPFSSRLNTKDVPHKISIRSKSRADKRRESRERAHAIGDALRIHFSVSNEPARASNHGVEGNLHGTESHNIRNAFPETSTLFCGTCQATGLL